MVFKTGLVGGCLVNNIWEPTVPKIVCRCDDWYIIKGIDNGGVITEKMLEEAFNWAEAHEESNHRYQDTPYEI